MICPFCLHTKTHVYNSRPTKRTNEIWRRRECLNCKKQFSTREGVDLGNILLVEEQGKNQQFSTLKLLSSIAASINHVDNIDEKATWLMQTIQTHLLALAAKNSQLVTPQTISEVAAATLHAYDYTSYVKYASAHKLTIKRR